MTQYLVAGVDEAGRGPLAGAVIAAAVILDEINPILGLADSKCLSARRRSALATEIKEKSVAWCIARADVEEIDRINILWASMLAMKRAVEGLSVAPSQVLVDGNREPDINYPVEAIIKGDAKVKAISAASILAKVARDEEMVSLDTIYPCYGFAQHKGYPTAAHIKALEKNGPSPVHRRSFGPVRRLLDVSLQAEMITAVE